MDNTPIYDNMSNEPEHEPRTPETGAPEPKVVAATVGAGVGSALATVVVWLTGAISGVVVPEAVELAVGVILTAALAFVGGYWKRS